MSDAQPQPPCDLSVVVPVYNEEENIPELHRQITAALDGKFSYEVLYVDDGSTDAGFERLKEVHAADSRAKVIRFRRNFGQTAAMSAGFDMARGQFVVPLDADLQNDPADIPGMVARCREGYDIVSGWRRDRKDKGLTRRLPSLIANRIISRSTGVKIHDFGCSLKVYRREVLEATRLYGEMHRFIPALAKWSGARICETEVNHRPRLAGTSKYGLARTTKVVLDLITVRFLGSYSTKPIYVFGGTGLVCGFGAVVSGVTVLWQKFISEPPFAMNRNPLLVLTALLIMMSVQFILMGLLAEIMVRTYHESQGRPIYVIRDILGGPDSGGDLDDPEHPQEQAPQDRATG